MSRLGAAGLLVVVAIILGCGGGDGGPPSTVAPSDPSHAVAIDQFATEVFYDEIVLVAKAGADYQDIKNAAAAVNGQVIGAVAEARLYQLRIPGQPDGAALVQGLETLRDAPGVDAAVPNSRATTERYPEDPAWDMAWEYVWHERAVEAPAAWDLATGGEALALGVIDAGFDATQPDLAPNLQLPVGGVPFLSDSEDIAHGTHVSGLLAAVGDNGRLCAGLCWRARVFAYAADTWLDLAEGITVLRKHQVRVVNISLGIDWKPWDLLTSQYVDARDKTCAIVGPAVESSRDVLLVTAAGNGNGLHIPLPAEYEAFPYLAKTHSNVVAVAATRQSGELTWFSNYGDAVTVAAPGQGVLSLLPGGEWGFMSGTSMASPIVAGVAGLAFSVNPSLTPGAVKEILRNATSAQVPGQPFGAISAYRAVIAARHGDADVIIRGRDVQ